MSVCTLIGPQASLHTVVLSCPLPLAVARIVGSSPLCFSFTWLEQNGIGVNRRFTVQKFRGFFQQKSPAISLLFDFNFVHGF